MTSYKDYLKIARFDHWFKNIFMIPGLMIAALFSAGSVPKEFGWYIILGILSAGMIASGNYIINEWLDRHFDKHHPVKKLRPSVNNGLKAPFVYLEYLLFIVSGIGLAWLINPLFLATTILFAFMGLLYNVSPIRTKEIAYLDVLTESINNPIRFMLGWAIIEPLAIPPVSILLAYWMGGAYLMGIKRYAEYKFINNPVKAGLYRQSFNHYDENSLIISSFFYALCSTFFLAVFLIKYRIEYILTFPLIAILFAWYLKIGLSHDSSAAQAPEKLYKEKSFDLFVIFLFSVFVILSFVDIPELAFLLQSTLISWSSSL